MKIESAEFVLSANRRDQFPRDGLPEVAFIGRSNVGKSSLMNRLLGRRGLARTSRSPGRTRAVNFFLINRRFYFADLPGYGFARVPKAERRRWAELMDVYFDATAQQAARRLLLQLVDAKVGATALDSQAYEYFQSLGLEPRVVATKIDKVPRSRRARSLASARQALGLTEDALDAVSAVSGEGVKRLWNEISAFLEQQRQEPRSTPPEPRRVAGAQAQQ